MKSKNTGTVICFNFTDEKFGQIESICKREGIRLKRPEKGDYEKPVGELAGFQNIIPEEGQIDFSEELMILANFLGTDFNKFLKVLRDKEISVPYKAMLTETNKSWTAAELAKQIKAEHEQMNK